MKFRGPTELKDTERGSQHNISLYCSGCNKIICKANAIFRINLHSVWIKSSKLLIKTTKSTMSRNYAKDTDCQYIFCSSFPCNNKLGQYYPDYYDDITRVRLYFKIFERDPDRGHRKCYVWKGDPRTHIQAPASETVKNVEKRLIEMLISFRYPVELSEKNIAGLSAKNNPVVGLEETVSFLLYPPNIQCLLAIFLTEIFGW